MIILDRSPDTSINTCTSTILYFFAFTYVKRSKKERKLDLMSVTVTNWAMPTSIYTQKVD